MKCPTCGNGIAPTQTECLFCQLWGSCIESGGKTDDIDTVVRRELEIIASTGIGTFNDSPNLQARTTDSRRSRKIGFGV